MNGRNPAIAAAFDGLNEYRIVGGISERIAQPPDCAADALVKIHEYVFRPERLPQFIATDHLAGMAKKDSEGAKGKILNPDFDPISAKLTRAQVGLENSKANTPR
jgi:hypothetical protein